MQAAPLLLVLLLALVPTPAFAGRGRAVLQADHELTVAGDPVKQQHPSGQQPPAESGREAARSPTKRRDYYVVALVFSGRKDRESILFRYLRDLMEKQEIDEVLVASLNGITRAEDAAWLEETARKSPHTKLFHVSWGYYEAYKLLNSSWTVPDKYKGRTVVLKLDDDIVYVDLAHFSEYTRFIVEHPEYFLVHANVVNNGVAGWYQEQRGLIPPVLRGTNLTMEYPAGGYEGSLLKNPAKARELHRWFLQRPESFSWSDPDSDNCIAYHPPGERLQKRFSVNWFGFLDSRIAEVIKLTDGNLDDEGALTTDNVNNRLCMHTRFVVSHLSFGSQASIDKEVIGWYKSLADRLLSLRSLI